MERSRRAYLISLGALAIGIASVSRGAAEVSPTNPYAWSKYEQSPFFDKDWWAVMKGFWPQAVNELRAANKSEKPGGVVLLGDSITALLDAEKFFPASDVKLQGISGDRVIGVINRLDVSVDLLRPRKILLLIGTNDTNNPLMTPQEFEAEYEYLVKQLLARAPKDAIFVQTIMPRGSYGTTNDKIVEYNQVIRDLCQEHGVFCLDVYHAFIDDEKALKKELSEDGVHLNERGQKVWAELLAPIITGESASAVRQVIFEDDPKDRGIIVLDTGWNSAIFPP